MSLDAFHPAVGAWFESTFAAPTPAQAEAWPAIAAGRHTLVAAPTGSGKTLAAFLAVIDALVREGSTGPLPDETRVLYVSPLKALSNDIHRNLEVPLAGIRATLSAQALADVEITTFVRTGDTTQAERNRMRRCSPHILVTTPESLYILLTSDSGRRLLTTVRTVIVDEIHALAGNKRGSHLTLSLERLEALTGGGLTRVGLSATQKPLADVAHFLVGDRNEACVIVDSGHGRERDLAVEVPRSPLEAVMATEVWQELYERFTQLIAAHRTTLIFVNTRRHAERVARHLGERIGEDRVAAHHGSLSREHRLAAEQRLKDGQLRVMVATASLELGIDIGAVDLVCQLGSPRAINGFLQRVGRSGHGVTALPKGRLFPLSRDDLVECTALLEAVRQGELDRLVIPQASLDVLAQQIVAEVACGEWGEDALYAQVRRAWPYRELRRARFDQVLRMLAEGFSTRRGRRSAYLHRDAVNRRLRPRKGAKLTAVTNGGAIPDQFDYDVFLEPEGHFIGTLNEDFAFESLPGDIFQLGNNAYRILRVEQGKVRVEDAHGQPPNIPFWFGEAPGRTDELSQAVSRLRAGFAQRLEAGGLEAGQRWFAADLGLSSGAACQLSDYLGAAHAALQTLPTQEVIVFERFFDEAGDMHLVIHSSFGSRLNRAWGLALRKRFCRRFNFELQAAALEDSIVLSLSTTHSFELTEVARYLKAHTVRDILIQALLDAPMFAARWRWSASIALAVKRFRGGKRIPAQLQRMDAEDLVAVVFPDQLACVENRVGDREIPDHPLVNQTIADCLHEAMDVEGLERLLKRLEAGKVRVVARNLTGPSPLAQEILTARPYAFLDDAPAEERRTQAVQARRFMDPESAADLGRLDAAAIQRVRDEVWPEVSDADELHDALLVLGFLTEVEGRRASTDGNGQPGWEPYFEELAADGRAARLERRAGQPLWVAAERLAQLRILFPDAVFSPAIEAPPEYAQPTWEREEALRELVRGRLEALGPVTAQVLAQSLGAPIAELEAALVALESEGFVLRGQFTGDAAQTEWCERRLLARIHRYTVNRLRREIEPVTAAEFMGFLFRWQGLSGVEPREGAEALAAVLEQLEGVEAAAAAWESDILPARLSEYSPQWLDTLCLSGRIVWGRLTPPRVQDKDRNPTPLRSTPIAWVLRRHRAHWQQAELDSSDPKLSSQAQRVLDSLQGFGASFFEDLVEGTGLLRSQVETALGELVARGLVSADSFIGLRALLTPSNRRRPFGGRRRGRAAYGVEDAGRWVLLRQGRAHPQPDARPLGGGLDPEALEHVAHVLLRRYGVVFRKLLVRENALVPPWRDLLYVYRRLEARGEVRGGRFVAGFSGEQYALPEAVGLLRDQRKQPKTGELVSISAADPLNLVGLIIPGDRVPALAGNRILYRDGVPIAIQVGGDVRYLTALEPSAQWRIKNALLRRDAKAQVVGVATKR